jgi:hypothetical protein
MNDHLTSREFDQFRIDDREWKRQMDERMDTFFTTLGSQDRRLSTIESASIKATATSNKMIVGISTIVTAIVNGIIASFASK